MKINYLFLSAILGFALIAAAGCGKASRQTQASPETVRDVDIATLQKSTLPSYYDAVGTVRPVQTAQVASQVMGTIVHVNVREGDRVSRGQVLAVIDDSQTRAALDRATAGQRASAEDIAAANSDFALAESTLKRYQLLQEKKSISAHEFEQVTARYEAAKARRDLAQASKAGADAAVAQARTTQGYTQIRAPFAGVVTAKLADTGSLASPGMPLFTVEDTTRFRLEVDVDEANIGAVRIGSDVTVTIDALEGKTLVARVAQILPAADAGSRSFQVKLDLPQQSTIRSGLFGRAQFPTGTQEGFSIPNKAVIRRGSMQAVYVVGPDRIASLRYVTLGRSIDDRLELLSGIENGDRVVLNPGDRELNGKKIEVR